VKRGSPRSRFAAGGPEPPVACSARLRTGEAAREADVRVVGHGAERLRDESDPRASAARPRAGWSLRREATEYGCSSLNGFGVQKSIGRIAGRDARGRYQAHHGHARPRPKESPELRQSAGEELGRRRCAGPAKPLLIMEERTGPGRTRKPRRDRIRRGAGSGTREVQGPRACGCRYDGRVSGHVDASP
jgi:hypothetical protein